MSQVVSTLQKDHPLLKPRPISAVIAIEPVSLDIKQAAAFLGTTVRQVRSLIYSRELIPVRLGKKQLLIVDDLRQFIQKLRNQA